MTVVVDILGRDQCRRVTADEAALLRQAQIGPPALMAQRATCTRALPVRIGWASPEKG
jgi:hypothetical protein